MPTFIVLAQVEFEVEAEKMTEAILMTEALVDTEASTWVELPGYEQTQCGQATFKSVLVEGISQKVKYPNA